MNETIGYVVGGGLKEGLNIRLTIPADRSCGRQLRRLRQQAVALLA